MLQSDHKQNAWRRKFTLLEMMVVLVMITILLAVIVPAFQKISTGSAVNAASRMLSAQFRLARAEAIARRQYIAVILPGEHFIQDSDEENPPIVYRYQSFRAAIVSNTGAGFEFVEWVEGTQWTFLPTGALVAEADDDAEELTSADPPLPVGNSWEISDDSALQVNDVSDPGNNVRAVIFKPNGRCVQKTYVTIMEGIFTVPDPTVPEDTNQDPVEDPVNESQPAFERENKFNIRVMEISPFTGKVRFLY